MSIASKALVSGRDFPATWDQFLDWFPDNAACLRYLEKLRWPDGFVCPRCGGMDEPYRAQRARLRCRACDYQGTVTAGTVFAKTRTPLRSWFAGVWYVTSQKHGVSALGLQRVLGLGSYQTAWTMLHRLRRAMVRPARERLSGKVEVDETYVGGPGRGLGRKNTIHMRHWRNDTFKAIVVVAVECMSRRDSAAYACVEFLKPLESICCRSYQKLSPPARSFTPTDYPFTSRYPNGATVTNAVSLLDRKALRTSRCLACTALPLCLRDGCWELTRGPSKRVSLTTISTNTLFGLIVGRRARAVCFSTDCLSRLSRPSPSHIVTS